MPAGIGSIHTSQVLTADGVVGTSGEDTIVFAATIKGGSAVTTAVLHEGTGTGGTKHEDAIAPVNNSVTVFYGDNGVHYPGGCYLNITTTGGSVTVVYNQD
jgi:hypothetical protein